LDETDRRLALALGRGHGLSLRRLADQLGLSPSAVHKRLRAMQGRGVLGRLPLVPNPVFFDAMETMVFGQSGAGPVEGALRALGRSPCTSRVMIAGGNEIFVWAVISSMSELERYADFVRREARMPESSVGILRPAVRAAPGARRPGRLDFRIMRALREDCRRPLVSVGRSLGVSARTVGRRLRRLTETGAVRTPLPVRPFNAGDLLAVLRMRLREPRSRQPAAGGLPPGVLSVESFTNIPQWSLGFLWGRDLSDVAAIRQALERSTRCVFGVLNFVWLVRDYPTWLDKVMARLAETGPGGPAGPAGRAGLPRGDLDVHTRLDTYRRALAQALEDGVITDDEEAILRALRESLDISHREHRRMVAALRPAKE